MDENKARQIAKILGWEYVEGSEDDPTHIYHIYDIRRADGAQFHLRTNDCQYPGRIVVRGDYPRGDYSTYDIDCPTITVSDAKTPAAIAKDIQRRFLPLFLKAHEECVRRQKAHEETEQGKARAIEALAKAVGTVARGEHIHFPNDCIYGSMRVDGPDSVRIDAGLPFDLAMKVAQVIREANQQ